MCCWFLSCLVLFMFTGGLKKNSFSQAHTKSRDDELPFAAAKPKPTKRDHRGTNILRRELPKMGFAPLVFKGIVFSTGKEVPPRIAPLVFKGIYRWQRGPHFLRLKRQSHNVFGFAGPGGKQGSLVLGRSGMSWNETFQESNSNGNHRGMVLKRALRGRSSSHSLSTSTCKLWIFGFWNKSEVSALENRSERPTCVDQPTSGSVSVLLGALHFTSIC